MQPISQPIKLCRHVDDLCECGQPARWSCLIPVGKNATMHPYKLCDDCLELELGLYQPNPDSHNNAP